jgi:phosphonate transport system substrate-binding protein
VKQSNIDLRSRILFALLLLGAVVLVAGCGGQGDAQEGQRAHGGEGGQTAIRFAVPDLEGLEELQREFGPFQKELSEVLGAEVEFFPVPDHTAVAAAMQADRVDLVLAGPSEYVLLQSRTDAVPVVGISRPGYRGVIATRANSGIESVGDLRGEKIATFAPGGTTTHLTTCRLLQEADIDCQEDVELL